jgi:hypothetical protein
LRATLLDQRARLPGIPPIGMLVNLVTIRTIAIMAGPSHGDQAWSRRVVSRMATPS